MEQNILHVYTTPAGKSTFDDDLEAIKDAKAQKLIDQRLIRLETGLIGKCKLIEPEKEITELILDYGAGYRVYIAQLDLNTYLLLAVGSKGNQKKDIKRAKGYLAEYKSRE